MRSRTTEPAARTLEADATLTKALDPRRRRKTTEGLFPLLVALGAAGEGARGKTLHESFTWRSLSMRAFAFDG